MGEKVKSGAVQIEGIEYRWSIYRQPTWTSTRALLGLAILVESMEPSKRALLLEFAIDRSRHGDMPQHQRFRVSNRRLIECIQNAMKAGWDPLSRGKRFVFEAGPVISN
jgi:hypothetical protein